MLLLLIYVEVKSHAYRRLPDQRIVSNFKPDRSAFQLLKKLKINHMIEIID